jgi:hypothetical protein
MCAPHLSWVVSTYSYIHTHIHTYTHTYIPTQTYIHARTHTHTHARTRAHTHIHDSFYCSRKRAPLGTDMKIMLYLQFTDTFTTTSYLLFAIKQYLITCIDCCRYFRAYLHHSLISLSHIQLFTFRALTKATLPFSLHNFTHLPPSVNIKIFSIAYKMYLHRCIYSGSVHQTCYV